MIDWLLQAGIAILTGAAIGATVAYFWDDITDWVSRVFNVILDGLNRAIEWAIEGVAFIIREGGKVTKGVMVLIRNMLGKERIERYTEDIEDSKIPNEIRKKLKEDMAILIAKQSF